MRVLFVETDLVEELIPYDQIVRLGDAVAWHAVSLAGRGVRTATHPRVRRAPVPFFPKVERVKAWMNVRAALRAHRALAADPGVGPFDLLHAHFAYPQGLAAKRVAAADVW